MTEATAFVKVTYHLDHDFNNSRNEGGFHEVVIPSFMEELIRTGMVVDFGDSDYHAKGRIRCLVAVIEEVE